MRDVLRTSSIPAERVVTPMMRLRDPAHTRIPVRLRELVAGANAGSNGATATP
jgi:hypothetical protein